jgi:hypothetical protein
MIPVKISSLSHKPFIGKEGWRKKFVLLCWCGGQTDRQTDSFIGFPVVSPQQRKNLFD